MELIFFSFLPAVFSAASSSRSPPEVSGLPGRVLPLPELLTTSGLLYHGMGFEPNKDKSWTYPQQKMAEWMSKGLLYQESMTYVNSLRPVIGSQVGILLNPEDPDVTIHIMGEKDLYYSAAIKEYPSPGLLDGICNGDQGIIEARRAFYNAANWQYTLYINQCYQEFIQAKDANGELKKLRVRYFSGSPIEALKLTENRAKHWQGLGYAPRRCVIGQGLFFENPSALWNEIIVSAPVTSIAGVVMWTEDPDDLISAYGTPDIGKYSQYWFDETCKAVQQVNPNAKMYRMVGGTLREVSFPYTAQQEPQRSESGKAKAGTDDVSDRPMKSARRSPSSLDAEHSPGTSTHQQTQHTERSPGTSTDQQTQHTEIASSFPIPSRWTSILIFTLTLFISFLQFILSRAPYDDEYSIMEEL